MILRPYQQAAVDAVLRDLEQVGSTLIVIPTGGGKTVVFAHVAKHFAARGRVLMIAHRAELVQQGREKIGRVTGVLPDVEMAGQWADVPILGVEQSPFIVSTIQTQTRGMGGTGRMTRFVPNEFSLLIIDEAHHAVADTYKRLIAYYRQNPDLRVLGVTATPDRADESALGQVFERWSFKYDIEDAVRDGWLVNIVQRIVHVGDLDFSKVHTVAGDLNLGELAAVMEAEGPMHGVAHPTFEIACGLPEGFIKSVADDKLLTYRHDWPEYLSGKVDECRRRKTLVFTASVAQAQKLCEIFNRWKQGSARFIDGKTDDLERRRTLRDYAAGKFQFLCNCAVFTEGFDEPSIEVIAVARPTKSRALYSQMVGRGTRPLDGIVDGLEGEDDADGMYATQARREAIRQSAKTHVEVLDFVGNSGQHKLMTAADILGGRYPDDVVQLAKAKAAAAGTDGRGVDIREALEESEAELERRRLEAEERRAAEAAGKMKLVGTVQYTTTTIDAFNNLDVRPKPVLAWMKDRRATSRQIELINRLGGFDGDPAELSSVHASQVIDALQSKRRRSGWSAVPQKARVG